jgi:hypothetical protein
LSAATLVTTLPAAGTGAIAVAVTASLPVAVVASTAVRAESPLTASRGTQRCRGQRDHEQECQRDECADDGTSHLFSPIVSDEWTPPGASVKKLIDQPSHYPRGGQ